LFRKEVSVERSSPSPSVLVPQPSRPPRDTGVETSVFQREQQGLGKARLFFRRNVSGYLFLLPALLIFALFVWYPLVLGLVMSFQNVDMINAATWVGWSNYQKVLSDPLFGIAW